MQIRQNIELFSSIATYYDRLSNIISIGLQKKWKKDAVDLCEIRPEMSCLDLCSGTGDIAIDIATRKKINQKIIGIDICPAMLEIAKRRSEKLHLNIDYLVADIAKLDFLDETFDVITIGFGLRNTDNPETCIKESFRVLKKGGVLVCLETDFSSKSKLMGICRMYMEKFIPFVVRLFGYNPAPYMYFAKSINSFWTRDICVQKFYQAGFSNVIYKKRAFGCVGIYKVLK